MSDRSIEQSAAAARGRVAGHESLEDTLTRIAHAATMGLGADATGLSLLDADGRATTAVFTDDTAPEIDQAQYDSDRGPCLAALREKRVVRVESTGDDDRWPEYAAAAQGHGIHSSISLPLVIDDQGIGALNLYARPEHRFDTVADEFGMAFAAQAAAAVANGVAYWEKATLAEQLQQAMESRAVIEQAKGIIMASSRCSPDEAFRLLREQSQAQNIKLRDIAVEMVRRQQRTS